MRKIFPLLFLLTLTSACGRAPSRDAAVSTPSASPATTVTTGSPPPPTAVPSPRPKRQTAATTSAAKDASLRAGDPATIAVSVAVVWGSTAAPHSVDAPVLENPVRIRTWLSRMSTDQRRSLGPARVNTSVLLDERVIVTAVKGSWAHVVVPSQKSPWDSRGYPGWVPLRQLSAKVPPAGSLVATVTAKTSMLRSLAGSDVLEVSYATRLPVVKRTGALVQVWHPDGRTLAIAASDVSVHAANEPAAPPTAASVIADAKRFLGLPYLWDGSSSYGFDCSGITYQVFRTHGVLLPRDSFGQVTAGRAVERSSLAPGDLIFFANKGKVHHVGIWLGGGKMLHAPHTGASVEIVTLADSDLNREYDTARRFF